MTSGLSILIIGMSLFLVSGVSGGSGLPWSEKNIWKMNFFLGQGKSGNFVDGQGNLERTWKVREKSGNLKINGR